MEWRPTLAAIRISSVPTDTVVHVVERDKVETYLKRSAPLLYKVSPGNYSYSKVQVYCGLEVDLSILNAQCEREGTDVNCEQCVAGVEKQQAFWDQFWRSAEGIQVIKILTGFSRIEQEFEESNRRFEAFYRSAMEFNDLLNSCLKHKEPVFTLELPDEILLKLINYSCVGEVLLAFKLDAESRQILETEVGGVGFALLGSRLISKGYLKSNDPIFRNWK